MWRDTTVNVAHWAAEGVSILPKRPQCVEKVELRLSPPPMSRAPVQTPE